MATNAGKKFEEDFKNSVNTDEIFLQRLKLMWFYTLQGRLARPCGVEKFFR